MALAFRRANVPFDQQDMQNKIPVLYVDLAGQHGVPLIASCPLAYTECTALTGGRALGRVREKPIDIIISDQPMPERTGVELLEQIIKVNPEPMRILLTGYADMSAVVDAVNKGKIFHYLSKPWSEEELSETIERAY